MATIRDLPPETIEHIIKAAFPVDSERVVERRARRKFLLATSLVCRAWTPFAQEALWEHVDLQFDHWRLPAFVASGPGRYPVETLSLDPDLSPSASVEAVLTTVRGMRELEVLGGLLNAAWLSGSNLRDLKSLKLFGTAVACPIEPLLPFNLKEFYLYRDRRSTPFLHALSRQSSISSLSLGFRRGWTSDIEELAPLAAQLITLCVEGTVGTDDFFRQCTRLKHLSIEGNAACTLHLEQPLESLTIINFSELCINPVLDAFKVDAVGLAELQILRLQVRLSGRDGGILQAALGWQRWSKVEEVCKTRKIKLILEAE